MSASDLLKDFLDADQIASKNDSEITTLAKKFASRIKGNAVKEYGELQTLPQKKLFVGKYQDIYYQKLLQISEGELADLVMGLGDLSIAEKQPSPAKANPPPPPKPEESKSSTETTQQGTQDTQSAVLQSVAGTKLGTATADESSSEDTVSTKQDGQIVDEDNESKLRSDFEELYSEIIKTERKDSNEKSIN
jgi:hypothetical protein